MLWQQQWELFAPNFKQGKAHIDLSEYGFPATLQLYPGPGFGDVSHPTTRLVLRLISSLCKNRFVIDVGCGSGILSIAAAAMGASEVYGYDIDPEAVAHAHHNLELSHERARIVFSTEPPAKIPQKALILMNMIDSEQQVAWHQLAPRIIHPATVLISGILTKDAPDYLKKKESQNHQLLQTIQEGEWSGFTFSYSPITH